MVIAAYCAAFSYFGQFIHMQVSCRCYLCVPSGKKLHVIHQNRLIMTWDGGKFFFFFWIDRSSMESQVCWVLHWLWSLYVMLANSVNILEPGCTWLFKILVCMYLCLCCCLFCSVCLFCFVCLFVCSCLPGVLYTCYHVSLSAVWPQCGPCRSYLLCYNTDVRSGHHPYWTHNWQTGKIL